MFSSIRKIYRRILYSRYFVVGMKIPRLVRNLSAGPVIFDVFITAKGRSVCAIAPYFSKNAFLGSACSFDGSEARAVPVSFVEEPESSCLIALYPIPEHMEEAPVLGLSIRRKGKPIYEGLVRNIRIPPKKHLLSITTLIKYEAAFVPEWIEHHSKIGVEHFYIYDNNAAGGSSPIREAVGRYVQEGLVTYIPWPYPYRLYDYRLKPFWPEDAHFYTQISQIHHAIYRFAHETEWLLACDVDEYFHPARGGGIKASLESFRKAPAIQVSGYYVDGTADELRKAAEDGVVVSFKRREKEPTSPKKLIINTAEARAVSIHEILEGKPAIPISPTEIYFDHYRALGWKKRLDGR
ncbi:MAG: glycosyltransferase family 92 protein [Patescibacteria group bacterium]|nr:glycosyltransferase family 92 protein [Patescibacteria group bacterium]